MHGRLACAAHDPHLVRQLTSSQIPLHCHSVQDRENLSVALTARQGLHGEGAYQSSRRLQVCTRKPCWSRRSAPTFSSSRLRLWLQTLEAKCGPLVQRSQAPCHLAGDGSSPASAEEKVLKAATRGCRTASATQEGSQLDGSACRLGEARFWRSKIGSARASPANVAVRLGEITKTEASASHTRSHVCRMVSP